MVPAGQEVKLKEHKKSVSRSRERTGHFNDRHLAHLLPRIPVTLAFLFNLRRDGGRRIGGVGEEEEEEEQPAMNPRGGIGGEKIDLAGRKGKRGRELRHD